MNIEELKTYVRDVPDFPKPGIVFKDITPLLASPQAFPRTIDLLEHEVIYVRKNTYTENFDMFAAAESRGFLFAAPLADRMEKGLTILRKPGKLPYVTHKYEYDLEYGKSEMHMHVDAVTPGSRVIVVDDLLATGGTVEACCKLIEKGGGHVIGCLFVVELEALGGRQRLEEIGYPVYSLLRYS